MAAVVPGIGEIGIKRHQPEGGQQTLISVVFSDSNAERTLQELGGGVEQILALALVLIGERDEGPVFVEEPESHLHESAQRRLIEQIEKHRGSRQIVIATHSPVFINAFPGANVYRVTRGASLRDIIQVCRHNFMICDRDSGVGENPAKAPVQGIAQRVGVNHWITRGYEIEWYIPQAIIASIWDSDVAAHMATCTRANEPFYERLAGSGKKTKSAGGRKVQWAERIVEKKFGSDVWFADETGQELRSQVERLATYIRQANQIVTPTPLDCRECGRPIPAADRR